MIQGLDHIAIAVPDLEAAVSTWQRVLAAEVLHREVVAEQQTEVVMLRLGDFRVELICPTSPDSPVAKFLATRGSGIHHVALRSDATQVELDHLQHIGAPLIDKIARTGAEGTRVGFVHPRALGGVLVEIVEHGRP